MLYRKYAGDGRPLAGRKFDRDCTAMQFDERANQRKPQSWPAMLGASGVRFEPVEHAILGFRRNTRAMIGHGEYDRVRTRVPRPE